MTDAEADAAQHWSGMDGATAFLLINRHAEDWHETGQMMSAWLRANANTAIAQASDGGAQDVLKGGRAGG